MIFLLSFSELNEYNFNDPRFPYVVKNLLLVKRLCSQLVHVFPQSCVIKLET